MTQKISFDFSNTKALAADADVAAMKDRVIAAKKTLVEKTGEGNDFLGWIDLPVNYDKESGLLPENFYMLCFLKEGIPE